MAVVEINGNIVFPNTLRQYVGLHADAKPTEGVGVNSLFLELDTKDVYYFNGTTWVKCGA